MAMGQGRRVALAVIALIATEALTTGCSDETGPLGPGRIFPAAPAPPDAGASDDDLIVETFDLGFADIGIRFDAGHDAGRPDSVPEACGEWEPIPPAPEAWARERFAIDAVWTGQEVVMWNQIHTPNTNTPRGVSYRPATGEWSALPAFDLLEGAPSIYPCIVWTGEEVLMYAAGWGELGITAALGQWTPGEDEWSSLPLQGAPEARSHASCSWTGEALVVYGGRNDETDRLQNGGLFHLASQEWRPIAEPPELDISFPESVWTGRDFVVHGWNARVLSNLGFAAYRPASDQWTSVLLPPELPWVRYHIVPTPRGFIGFGGWGGDSRIVSTAIEADLDSELVRALPAPPLAPRASTTVATWNDLVMVWGGIERSRFTAPRLSDGALFDHRLGTWAVLPTEGAPLGVFAPALAAIDDGFLVWGGSGASTVHRRGVHTGAIFRPCPR
ncbi:MAG: hypothetical protein AAGJ19_00320 [Myxococcota bacterium]